MKLTSIIIALVATAVALPTDIAKEQGMAAVEMRAGLEARSDLETRQIVGSTVNELTNGACRDITFIFARGSTETGNIGLSVGPPTCSGLKQAYGSGNVACQGVGSPYTAGIADNTLPEGTSTAAYGEAERLFNLANTKCPNTIIVGGGYSQGAAVMTAAVRRLSANVQDQIAGVVLYGNTRNAQTNGHIPSFPTAKSQTYCAVGDGVCGGALIVTAAHLSYLDDVPAAVSYLQGRISIAQN